MQHPISAFFVVDVQPFENNSSSFQVEQIIDKIKTVTNIIRDKNKKKKLLVRSKLDKAIKGCARSNISPSF